MAKDFLFNLNGKKFNFSHAKIERKKLYGWTEKAAVDDEGNELRLVSMDESGTVIIPKGGAGLGILDNDFKWVNRSELVAVKDDGSPAEIIESTFEREIELTDTVTIEEFLNYSITVIYELESNDYTEEFLKEVSNKIYTFNYNYRSGFETYPAFVVATDEGKVFVLSGTKNEFSYTGLDEPGFIDEDEEEDIENDELDFSMM
ncbi:MAG TPA: hypothetical protein VF941_04545 [Clostridia bacterium]